MGCDNLQTKTIMKKILISLTFALSLLAVGAHAGSYDNAAPLSASLDGWPYPYPVKTFHVVQQGRSADMVYMDVTPSSAPKGTVLMFHGKNFGSDYWAPTIAGLTKAGYRVIAPDQVGFAKSSKPDIHYHFDDLAKNTKDLLDMLKVDQVYVIANSMGGMLGVRFAILYPTVVRKLVLENPLGLEDYSLAVPPQTNENLLKLEMAQTEDSYRAFMKSYFPTWDDTYDRFVEIYARVQKSPDYPVYARASVQTYQMIADQPTTADLAKLNMPTLLIIGQRDKTVFGRRFAPPEAVKSLGNFPQLGKSARQVIPQAQLLEVPNAGHAPHLEVPELYNDAVLKFFSGND